MLFIQARHFTRGPRRGPVELVVLHSMESPEGASTAEDVARYFAKVTRPASAHYCVDSDSIVACVREADIAYAAPGANHNGVHVELAGRAAQTAKDWSDPYSTRMLREQAAPLVASICKRYAIPQRFVDAAGLKAGLWGITTHAEVTAAFHRSTHTDPGPGFPVANFVRMVQGVGKEDVDMTKDELVEVLRTALSPGFTTVSEWAEQLNQVRRNVEQIKAEQEELKAAVDRITLAQGGQ